MFFFGLKIWITFKQRIKEFLIATHAVPVAIIRSWPDSENCLIKMPLVSLHNQLMSTADQVNVICRIKLRKKNYYKGM